MVLPLIGSFLASSFAPAIAGATGLSFLANPLVMGFHWVRYWQLAAGGQL